MLRLSVINLFQKTLPQNLDLCFGLVGLDDHDPETVSHDNLVMGKRSAVPMFTFKIQF